MWIPAVEGVWHHRQTVVAQVEDQVPLFVMRLMRRFASRFAWALPFVLIGFVFATSWPLMILAEPAGAPITQAGNYWWWFLVTASTVGYGDFYPTTTGGHLVGVYVIIGGIATLTTLFAKLASAIESARGRRMRGSVSLNISDHIVILGYTPGRTDKLVHELLADNDHPLVVCAWEEVESHPLPDQPVDFVRGDLNDEEVLRRARVPAAHSVLIDARDDNEALVLLVTVDHLTTDDTHLVVALRDLDRATHLKYVNPSVRCVQWHAPRMITEELQAPGITQLYTELMTYSTGGNTYSVRLPESVDQVTFGDCQTVLGKTHDATVLAVRSGDDLLVSPPWQTRIAGGSVLYYISRERLLPEEVARTLSAQDVT